LGAHRGEAVLEFCAEPPGLRVTVEHRADQPVQREVVTGAERAGDDDLRHELGELVGELAAVPLDVEDRVRRRQFADPVKLDFLGPAELRDPADGPQGWMQNPARPTSWSARPKSQTSSVMLGTRQTIRGPLLIFVAGVYLG
jgi:hypothetical protein